MGTVYFGLGGEMCFGVALLFVFQCVALAFIAD